MKKYLHKIMTELFWLSGFLVFWVLLLFPLLVFVLSKFTLDTELYYTSGDNWPDISIIIIAHNEENKIRDRIKNCKEAYYPGNKEIIVCSDASTDNTAEIADSFEEIKVVEAKKQNKTMTRELGIKAASGSVLLFTDCDSIYQRNAVIELVKHYKCPKVGCVGGEIRSDSFSDGSLGAGQGLYWLWEYSLRRSLSRLGLLTKVSGANMSMRAAAYKGMPDTIDIDQAAGPMVVRQGYRVIHEPRSVVSEHFPTALGDEFKMRKRLTIRGLTEVFFNIDMLNPFKYPLLSFTRISYRLFRYFLPVFILSLVTSNMFIIGADDIYLYIFLLLLFIFVLSVVGLYCSGSLICRLIAPISSLLWFNIGVLVGLTEYCVGGRLRHYG
jgi:cellulose synthase/poly-beta-1,6-N-acetylglucosamine synthase-like glycosyltransferase